MDSWIFDAYEVSCRARTEDLLYNAGALIRPKKVPPLRRFGGQFIC